MTSLPELPYSSKPYPGYQQFEDLAPPVNLVCALLPTFTLSDTNSFNPAFQNSYDGTGEFDRYPEEFEGGTILVLRGETMTVPEYLQTKEDKKNKKKKSAAEKQKEKEKRKAEREKLKELKKKEKEKAKLLKKLEAKLGKTYNFSKVSPYYEEMKEIMKEYETEWANIDEKQNVNEDPYMEWISLDKFAEAHQELRLAVDELMRVEFELLRKALAEDRRKKYKPQKKKKQKKKKGKRGKKKKQPKDLTADRTIESLYHELKDYGLIKEMPRANLDEHVGEYNLSAYEKRMIYMQDPPPGHGEIKSVIREAIIGMGPLDVSKAKSILIAGAPNSGKQFLVQAIASEVGAIVFDISPENVVQFEANMKYFLHLINKMSRALQPTILYINQCERLFWKKVPKDQTDIKPRLLGKYIIKQIVKPIKKEDKVLVLGISNEPFKAKLGKMKKCFERIIIVPRADYGTTFQIHRVLAMKKYGLPRDFDFSAVSMVTKGYASSVVYNNLNATLGIERRMKFPIKPLKAQELIEGYFNREEPKFPITDDEFAKYIKFYTKANKLAKQRVKFMKEQEKLKAKEKPKGKK
ncbi:unnamed protein product [Hermetia illucens]|uniref:ATPase AAA-type core domain-containing protein n=1 Tax=Hermetia illucens TaxID=343691 RepID=A0A7R8UIG7_HERIL|nr:unnamed protein product [Hermetia illucens]